MVVLLEHCIHGLAGIICSDALQNIFIICGDVNLSIQQDAQSLSPVVVLAEILAVLLQIEFLAFGKVLL